MRITKTFITTCAALATAVTLAAAGPAWAAGNAAQGAGGYRPACGPAMPGDARCFSLFTPQVKVNTAIAARAAGHHVPKSATTPQGLGATDIESAYKLPVSQGAQQTVAVVAAFSTPNLASDLAAYRTQYGLPPCTTASGCLRIVNQSGKPSPLPRAEPYTWGVEETLDVSMVSAACPLCKIILVEASSASLNSLARAENTAVKLGAEVVSNSYGAPEATFTQMAAKHYDHPGHTIVVASGDSGYTTANFPANLATVTAVGGTQLTPASNPRGWDEKVWDVHSQIYGQGGASGSGCSAWVAKPSWQHDPACTEGRAVADVSAVAWNVAVYDSSLGASSPWQLIGGTSVAAPLIAGVYALAGNATTAATGYEYAHVSSLFDVTTGNNDWINNTHGASCAHDYLCVAKKGYDAPTGLGTPDGTGAF